MGAVTDTIERIQEISGKTVAFHKFSILDKSALQEVFAQHGNVEGIIHLAGRFDRKSSTRQCLILN